MDKGRTNLLRFVIKVVSKKLPIEVHKLLYSTLVKFSSCSLDCTYIQH
jgi:hypothetical protein